MQREKVWVSGFFERHDGRNEGLAATHIMTLGSNRQSDRLPLREKNVYAHDGNSASVHSMRGASPKPEAGIIATPPRKRAVPLDGIHARNVPEYSREKRVKTPRTNVLQGSAHGSNNAYANTGSFPHTRSTTTRIDRSARVSHEERYQRERQKVQSQRQWKVAFGRAFPKFVFYLDGMDEAQRRTCSSQIVQLGATVEDFFSRSVTHVVTTRPIPVARDIVKEISQDHSSCNHKQTGSSERGQGNEDTHGNGGDKSAHDVGGACTHSERPGISPPRILMPVPLVGVPLHSDRNPLDESTPSLPASDLLSKAQHFGMKIWRSEKLDNILSLLLADDAPPGAGNAAGRQNLSDMLLQEKLHGTTERDPLAIRSDVHYFGKNSYHVLVTDATGEHRPILMQEYDRHAHEAAGKHAPWPELHGDIEGRGLFVYVAPKERKRLAQHAPMPNPSSRSLRRAASLHLAHVRNSPAGPGTPNLMASDNSMALASTVASTTSMSLTSQQTTMQSAPTSADKRVLELHRRLHTPAERSNESHGVIIQRMLQGMLDGRASTQNGQGGQSGHCSGFGEAISLGDTSTGAPMATLHRSRSLGSMTRKCVSPSPRRREKKPGHCENCRCRFDDFYEHTRSRRHRNFALDESNFVNIDELLQRVQREPLPMTSSWADYAGTPPSATVYHDEECGGIVTAETPSSYPSFVCNE